MNDDIISVLVHLSVIVTLLIQGCQNISKCKNDGKADSNFTKTLSLYYSLKLQSVLVHIYSGVSKYAGICVAVKYVRCKSCAKYGQKIWATVLTDR